jgi:hypothetical protein
MEQGGWGHKTSLRRAIDQQESLPLVMERDANLTTSDPSKDEDEPEQEELFN